MAKGAPAVTLAGIGLDHASPVPLHRQPAFRSLAPDPAAFPEAEAMAADMLTLPSHPWMTTDEVDYVAGAILDFYRA